MGIPSSRPSLIYNLSRRRALFGLHASRTSETDETHTFTTCQIIVSTSPSQLRPPIGTISSSWGILQGQGGTAQAQVLTRETRPRRTSPFHPLHIRQTQSQRFLSQTPTMFKVAGDFDQVQASRPDFNRDAEVTYSKPPKPDWKQGDGGNDGGESLKKKHVEIDPYEEGRPATANYKFLISGMVPRPIALISTRSRDGQTTNLAPFSYSQVVNHDPPLFVVGFVGALDRAKDTLKNLAETEECVINIISEHFVEAANATAINAPYGVSEWEVSGLHQAPSSVVGAARVQESVIAIEGKLVETKEFESRQTGQKTGVLAIIEGVRFWARDDAIDEDKSVVDLKVLKPISRLGGIQYGRTTDALELPRPQF